MRAPLPVAGTSAFNASLLPRPQMTPPETAEVPASGVPDPYTPPCRVVPAFPPVRVGRRGGRRLVPHALRWRRRRLAVGVAVASAVLAVSAAYTPSPAKPPSTPSPGPPPTTNRQSPAAAEPLVQAPVRIADAATVGLLHPGDHVDVLAAAHVVATAATVVEVPEELGGPATTQSYGTQSGIEGAPPPGMADAPGTGGALVVLSVPRHVAAALSGASANSALAVALC